MDFIVRHRAKGPVKTENRPTDIFDDFKSRKKGSVCFEELSWLVICLFYLLISLVVIYCDVARFPKPLSVSDLDKSPLPRSHLFSEERARSFVEELSSIGPKPTGSYENEVLAVDYLLRQLQHIRLNSKPFNTIEIDLQKTTGCFPLLFKDGMTSCYKNIKNIVAKLGPASSTGRSLLVNCHFDSVPTSPGASDDLVNCAMMLEIMTSLSQHDSPLPHSVIFLFNGAEENLLQAAHGFVTQHKWAKEVVGFINLEACGAGGKQMMFQANKEQPWLVQAYADAAPYPDGSVIAQEIFQSGLIPSDTDYRIFEHFGGLPGLDFAFVKNGYVYHTKFDTLDAITSGAVQLAGENILNLIHQSLRAPAMQNSSSIASSELVFFDVLGIFMLVYQTNVATVLNVFAVVLTIIDIVLKMKHAELSGPSLKTRLKKLFSVACYLLGTLAVMIVANIFIASFLGWLHLSMTWYSVPAFAFGLYCCPAVMIMFGMQVSIKNKKKKNVKEDWLQEDIYFDSGRMIWLSILVVLQVLGINSSYICMVWVLFPTLIRGFIDSLSHLLCLKGSTIYHLAVHLFMQIIPLLVLFYCVWSMYTVFIPIMGRIGAVINPDVPIAILTAIVTFFSLLLTVSLIQVTTSMRKVFTVLGAISIVTIFVIFFTPLGFPYNGDPNSPSVLRSYILHTERTFRNKSSTVVSRDSGYWVVPLDYNGPTMLSPFIQGLKDTKPIDCDGELGCGMPFYIPVVSILRKSFYVPASKPNIHAPHKFQLMSHDVLGNDLHRLAFKATGPDHMTVFMSPYQSVELIEWSLYIGSPLPGLNWNDRKTFFIYYSYAESNEPWEFSIVLKAQKNHSGPLVDLSFITHHLHGHDAISGEFPTLLKKLPSWVHVTPWTCTLDMFTY